ncbi:hypothetical protein [Streptomyces resistomycificus]|uniref:Uncharacterized protein n=1 Tax=Streptomyces resistomycificus TaxID=67356 RepID=A0A0L8LRL7_9ACTN|nr:hypothetical protein [Streptomyces resistomycificus]KOG40828.1 hypothetical protein ADK37_07770 [Streptomyces resistomycificus]KUN99208.1 hypothetical protein AQJ84_12300 [Streptomyces resistomycificus]
MNGEQPQGQGPGDGPDFEERLRGLLAEDAYTIRPSPAPYPAIRHRGAAERRRRVAAAGAALVTLAAVPVGAYALGVPGGASGTASPQTAVSASRSAAPTPTASPTPTGPARPATDRQLFDGVSFEQAAEGLDKCLAYDRQHTTGPDDADLGAADEYRIILAMNSTGDSNTPGDGMFVVAVQEKPAQTRLICNIKDGEASGLNIGGGGAEGLPPDAGAVFPDMNGGKLYQQSFLDKGSWKLPFRWGVIGTVKSSVAKVTVSYGDATSEAALDHGWFVASGVLDRQVTAAPHVKGYDAGGKLVYDSDQDKYYEKNLP